MIVRRTMKHDAVVAGACTGGRQGMGREREREGERENRERERERERYAR
jgi:hypothetical protein